MKNSKKKVLLASALVTVCSCFALVACGKKDKPGTAALEVPANVNVTADELTWSAVTGATNGYTVKINTLQVKANAAGGKAASAYSTAVTYNYDPSTQFDAPTLTITGDTVTWNAIKGAVDYTVKINTDESTVVTTTSLDLTTVTTRLVTGDNTIAVKVNAVANGKDASDYSNSVKYNYAPTPEEEAADYKTLVTAIGSITAESTAAQASAVKAAITAAENKYAGMSAEAKALEGVVADKAAFDGKKDAFDEVYNPAKSAYYEFVTALNAATAEVTKAESLAALTEAKKTADEKKEDLNTLATSMITSEQSTAYAALATTITEWTANITAAQTEFAYTYTFTDTTVDLTTAEYAACEADIAAVNTLLTAYDN